MDTEQQLERLLRGEARAVARAISKIENSTNEAGAAAELMKNVFPKTGRAAIIGITGSPGAGKSSLVDKLALFYRGQDLKV